MKMKARTVVGRGTEGPLCDPGSELLPVGSASNTRIINGMEQEGEKKKKNVVCTTVGLLHFSPGVIFHSRVTRACPATTALTMRVDVRTTTAY